MRCEDVVRRANVERARARRAERERVAGAVATQGERCADRAAVAARIVAFGSVRQPARIIATQNSSAGAGAHVGLDQSVGRENERCASVRALRAFADRSLEVADGLEQVAVVVIAQFTCRVRGTTAVTCYRYFSARRAAAVRCDDVARRAIVERARERCAERARLAIAIAERGERRANRAAVAARIIVQLTCRARGTTAVTCYRDCRDRRAAAVRCDDVARRVTVERTRARRAERERLAVAVAARGERRADRFAVAAHIIAQPTCPARGTTAVTRH